MNHAPYTLTLDGAARLAGYLLPYYVRVLSNLESRLLLVTDTTETGRSTERELRDVD